MSYVAPVKDMLFVLHELAGLKEIQQLPGCEDATDETVQAVVEENARFMSEVVAPLNWSGDVQPAKWDNGVSHDDARLQGGVSFVCRGGLAGRPASDAIRRSGSAKARRRSMHGNDAGGESFFCPVPVAHRRCDRGVVGRGLAGTERCVSGEADRRQLDRHDEFDRAASGLRFGAGANQGGAARRRHVSLVRAEDLYHVR